MFSTAFSPLPYYLILRIDWQIIVGSGFDARKDPEHLPPNSAWQHFGNAIRFIPRILGSKESAFGFRVACATLTVGIIAFLHDTQTFFTEQRLVWAMIIISIGKLMSCNRYNSNLYADTQRYDINIRTINIWVFCSYRRNRSSGSGFVYHLVHRRSENTRGYRHALVFYISWDVSLSEVSPFLTSLDYFDRNRDFDCRLCAYN